MQEENLLKWFQEEILPSIAQSGKLSENGLSQSLESCEFEDVRKGDGFSSKLMFAKLILKSSEGTTILRCLIKFQIQDSEFREKMRTVPQFRNEIAMYTIVLPSFVEFLKNRNLNPEVTLGELPKCYFALFQSENPEKSVLILEDLRISGFKLADAVTELDLKHCLLAVGRLAEFHSVSFAMKLQQWESFEKLKNCWVEVWLSDSPKSRSECEEFKGYVVKRGIEYLLQEKNPRVPEAYLKKFQKLLEPIFDVLKSATSPKEPLSVICHGDFNRNNILFRYAGGEVMDAKLIDFQTFLYGSPCLDLSFFIYMNTTLEFREKHFDEIFDYYYSKLIQNLSSILNVSKEALEIQIPLQDFKEDFERVALHAYVTVSFFLPIMMTDPIEDFESDFTTKTFKEVAEENYTLGGEVVSKRIADVIVDFYRRKFYI